MQIINYQHMPVVRIEAPEFYAYPEFQALPRPLEPLTDVILYFDDAGCSNELLPAAITDRIQSAIVEHFKEPIECLVWISDSEEAHGRSDKGSVFDVTDTPWSVKPVHTPREDSDPMGAYQISQVRDALQLLEDKAASFEAGSEGEAYWLRERDYLSQEVQGLISQAPVMYRTLKSITQQIATVDSLHRTIQAQTEETLRRVNDICYPHQ